jgi:probable selenium-dependent hydroxylase accessory protein YqeC
MNIINVCKNAADHVLIEADGAAGRPVKAPEVWEPVIPSNADLVVHVTGLDCLGKPMTDDWVFRPERFTFVTGLQKGLTIRPRDIADLVTHPQGGLKHVPEKAAFVPFLNKQDLISSDREIEETAEEIMKRAGGRIRRVVSGSLTRSIFTTYP